MKNHGDDPIGCPPTAQVSVTDTTGAATSRFRATRPSRHRSAPSSPAGGDIPAPDTAAANGPTQGAIVLFLLDEGVSENRPLKLEIEHEGETGEITLDI